MIFSYDNNTVLKNLCNIGKVLFDKYNYLLFIAAAILSYLGYALHDYLSTLDILYNTHIEKNLRTSYQDFLSTFLHGINIIFIGILITYLYSFISYIFYFSITKNNEKFQKIEIDPLVIHTLYFISLLIESYFLKSDVTIYYLLIVLCSTFLLFYFFKQYKEIIYIQSFSHIFLKLTLFIIITFFIVNYKNIFLSFQLMEIDLKKNIILHTKQFSEKKKNEIVSDFIAYINETSLKDKKIDLIQYENELHIVIKNYNHAEK